MVKWVNLGFTKKDNWRHVKRGLKVIPLAKPVRLIEDPAIRTAGHLAAHPPVPAGGTAKIEEHVEALSHKKAYFIGRLSYK